MVVVNIIVSKVKNRISQVQSQMALFGSELGHVALEKKTYVVRQRLTRDAPKVVQLSALSNKIVEIWGM